MSSEAELQDMLKLQLTRITLGEHLDEPYFEELMKGNYVKVLTGNQYRFCEVQKVYKNTVDPPYEFPVQQRKKDGIQPRVDKVKTNYEICCAWANQKKRFRLNLISNKKATQGEFNAWKKACQ